MATKFSVVTSGTPEHDAKLDPYFVSIRLVKPNLSLL